LPHFAESLTCTILLLFAGCRPVLARSRSVGQSRVLSPRHALADIETADAAYGSVPP
jgi:hypothetical protein